MEYEIIKLTYTLRRIRNLAVVCVSVFWNTILYVYTNILCFQADKILLLTAGKLFGNLNITETPQHSSLITGIHIQKKKQNKKCYQILN